MLGLKAHEHKMIPGHSSDLNRTILGLKDYLTTPSFSVVGGTNRSDCIFAYTTNLSAWNSVIFSNI